MEIKETKPYTFIICGKARNGKDTIGGFIKEYYETYTGIYLKDKEKFQVFWFFS